jgi:TolA-binding protein
MNAPKSLRLIPALMLLSGCFYPADRGALIEGRVDKLEESQTSQLKALNQQRDELKKRLDDQEKLAGELQARIDKLEKAARSTDADLGIQVQSIRDDLAKLTGKMDETQYKIGQLTGDLDKVKLTPPGPAAPSGPEDKKKAELNQKLSVLMRPEDKLAFLKLANEQSQAGSSDVAMALYNEWLGKWGKEPQAADAHYMLGKLMAEQKNCREAIAEFGQVVQNWKKSDKVPPALLGTSDCFASLNMNEQAKTALEVLSESYADSQEGKQAKEKLKKLKKGK